MSPSRSDRRRNARRDRAVAAKVPDLLLFEDPTEGTQNEAEYPVELPCSCRISQRLRYQNGALVFFAIIWSRRDTFGNWREQYSCDSGHGYFHEHLWGHQRKNDRRNVRPLYSQVDVQECFDPAYDKVQDQHDKNCSGW